jgi:hypothetical protein
MEYIPILNIKQMSDEAWIALTEAPPWDPIEENQVTMDELLDTKT